MPAEGGALDGEMHAYTLSKAAIVGVCAAIMTTLAVVVVTACRCMRRKPGRPSFLLTRDVEKAQRTFYTRPTAKPISSPELSSPETGPSRHIPPTGKGSPHLTPTKWGSSGFPSPTQGEKRPPIGTFMGSTGKLDPQMLHKDSYSDGGDEKCEAVDNKTLESMEDRPNVGVLNFTVEYRVDKAVFMVTIHRASYLPAKDPTTGASDPYVKLCLLPEKKHKVKTRVLRKTLNPIYEETFTFYGLAYNQLQGVTLHFVVMSFDRFSRDEVIGEVVMPLSNVDLSTRPVNLCRDIKPRNTRIPKSQGRGELLTSLCYQPAANRLTVVVLKAKNLPKMDVTGLADPYVKIYVMYRNQRLAKKKTRLKKRTLNPVFNESFLFDIPMEGLEYLKIEFQVLDHDRVTKNEIIGRLVIGRDEDGEAESQHWKEIMQNPRKQIAEWHKLTE
eukprot:XP_003726123.1 PREDICTED: synaptotagmin-4 [Strongylocentrotus purpuratus]